MRRLLATALFTVGIAAADRNADLQNAARAGDIERVRILLEQGADVNARNAVGAAPLHEAAWSGNSELVDLLLARGADVNERHAEAGSTPLHYAVITNQPEIVKTLLRHGAGIHAISLWSDAKFVEGHRFYLRHGFQQPCTQAV